MLQYPLQAAQNDSQHFNSFCSEQLTFVSTWHCFIYHKDFIYQARILTVRNPHFVMEPQTTVIFTYPLRAFSPKKSPFPRVRTNTGSACTEGRWVILTYMGFSTFNQKALLIALYLIKCNYYHFQKLACMLNIGGSGDNLNQIPKLQYCGQAMLTYLVQIEIDSNLRACNLQLL